MLENLIILLIFAVALLYLGNMVYQNFFSKRSSCNKGCGGCSSIDISKIEKQIAEKGKF